MFQRASAFQPSTWAEVEDALASRKDALRASDPIIADILSFTNAPMRCIDAAVPDAKRPTKLSRASSALVGEVPPTPRVKRGNMQIDDILGLGRVDLESEAFVRRYNIEQPAPNAIPTLPVYRPGNAGAEGDEEFLPPPGALNPSSKDFNPVQYLSRLHTGSTVDDLTSGLTTLSDVSNNLRQVDDDLRASAHANLALASSVVAQARLSAQSSIGASKLLCSASAVKSNPLTVSGRTLDEKYGHILRRQSRIDTLKRVLKVVGRFGWILQLPSTLRAVGGADIQRIEDAARQVLRAQQWRIAQDTAVGPARAWIDAELEGGLDAFVATIERRLSTAAAGDQKNIARLVDVLELVEREKCVETALSARLATAKEMLRSAGRTSAVSALVRARVGAASGAGDAVELMTRMSNAFVDGLGEFWDLARVVASRPRWSDKVDLMLPTLVTAYAESVRSALLSDSHFVSHDAALEVGRAQRRVQQELGVPVVYLRMLDEVCSQVVELHLSSLARALRSSASTIARLCLEDGTVGSQLPGLSKALVEETVSEAKDLMHMDIDRSRKGVGRGDDGSSGLSHEERKSDEAGGDVTDSNLEALALTCVRVPEYVVYALRDILTERSRGQQIIVGSMASSSLLSNTASSQTGSEAAQNSGGHSSKQMISDAHGSFVLGTARCCIEFVDDGGVDSIFELVHGSLHANQVVQWKGRLRRRKDTVKKRIHAVMIETLKVYSKRLSPEVRWSARRVAELRSAEGMRTSQSVEIESASAQAVEVLLNMSLAVCRARRLGARTQELSLVEKLLTEQVAEVLLSSMTGSSGRSDMAAQIWVDISYLIAVLCDRSAPHGAATDKAKDSFLDALSLASEAVRRAGVVFGKPEEETLRNEAVAPSVARSRIMVQAMRPNGRKRSVPSSLWVHNAMRETIRLATAPPP